ncbi:MAG: hypothetical protein NVV66_13965 [Cellulomonas sp.]|uniref:hypothetical protein n=1 Tax=Cellulomonas sp. TaxID=40001 RepID=UPI0025903161|nr:hypothetical protein [Cellulomonas sp.]MCR6705738.1 hypothetical protein [Cellulomonas sp.]
MSFVDQSLVALSARLVDDETGKAVDDGWVKGRPRVGGYSFLNLIGDADGRGTTFALAGTYDLWTVAGGGSHKATCRRASGRSRSGSARTSPDACIASFVSRT